MKLNGKRLWKTFKKLGLLQMRKPKFKYKNCLKIWILLFMTFRASSTKNLKLRLDGFKTASNPQIGSK
jgi:hypothetical protein